MDDVEALLADLARWTADNRVGSAAESRVRERWLRQQAAEEALFAGLAVDLAERGTGMAVATTSGRTLRGSIVAVARDFCLIRQVGGQVTFVAIDAVASLRPDPGHRGVDAASERVSTVASTLVEALAGLAAERPRVRVVTVGAADVAVGELRAVGADVVTVRLDGGPASTVYLRLGAIEEVSLLH